ncbi:MAG: agmatinase [Gemmatimonadetes bacterium]|uniref:Agmatinase n=1 Tax=Candidatus Kutchimonas denitrificans TaxID=3056748 RepID=A0AAE4Z5T9_9BACT|nr:agmatinase [Gemmatimonadota bacterium]NIR74360.1 agmatinase [Candidatus Kutchimonas denitrificans]NIS02611.1 agmatinase [Gemmatimonadota bacterium]NIT68486.1 agmatinase [Gemmatimonadota bacterium]NIU51963.1 agmatinase [Gemmatimonadota bacterium]
MSDYSWEDPYSFLGLGEEHTALERAAAALLPVPYEATTSYMAGTRHGPEAILRASRHVELYDHELDREPYRIGIHTHPTLELTAAGPEAALGELRERYAEAADGDRLVIALGGEHTITQVPILYWADRLGDELAILQFDAHADLRDRFHGTRWSHACVMRRVVDRVRPVGVGIRAIDVEEKRLIDERGLTMIYAEELAGDRDDSWVDRALAALDSENVYVTFDVDFFDPAFMPSTGTPEPGGGTWGQAMTLLRRVFAEKKVVGADVVELAPLPGLVAPDFLVAKLIYKMIGYCSVSGGAQ